jgi:hypothetical protein
LGIHPLVEVPTTEEEVGNSVGVPRDVVKREIEVLEEFHPSGLSACDFLWLMEVLKVFMVGSNVNGVFCAKEVGATAFEPIDDGGHLFIVDVIVSFSR